MGNAGVRKAAKIPAVRRGQVSTEVTIILGFIVLLMLPILLNMYMQLMESNQRLSLTQANTAATRLAYAIDSVGNLGTNASMVVELKMPENVDSIYSSGTAFAGQRELVFRTATGTGTSEIVKMTRFNIIVDSSILRIQKPGTYNVEVISQEISQASPTPSVTIRLH